MSSNPILKWEKIQNNFYRTIEGYLMQWDVDDLSNYIVSSAPFGGAIALYRDPSRTNTIGAGARKHAGITLYTGSGESIRMIPCDNSKIIGLGWSEKEHFLIVYNAGIARYYYDFDGSFTEFSLGKQAESSGITEVQFYSSCFVARLTNGHFIVASNYHEPLIRSLNNPGPSNDSENIQSWTYVEQKAELIVAVDRSLYSTSSGKMQFQEGPYISICSSPDGSMLALLNDKHEIQVISVDLQKLILGFSISGGSPTIKWCGNDAITCIYNDELTVYPLTSGSVNLWFDSTVRVITEIDGIRIITREKHDFFGKVPDSTVGIFKLGSTAPGAVLRDCVDHLEKGSPRADENLMIIGDKLTDAVDTCIEGAGYEFEPVWQKKLLKAASFGKNALKCYNSDKYVRMLEYLRVLNNMREFQVGMLISYIQLIKLGPLQLIQRILLRNMHLLALKVADHLRLPKENIYVHWACAKVRKSNSDNQSTFQTLIDKLQDIPGISYEQIAEVALEEGRSELAVLLINREPRPYKQVPLLLAMGEDSLALKEAERSADMDLLVYTIMSLKKKLSLAAFFRLINDSQLPAKCFEIICKSDVDMGIELLKNFYYQDDRRTDNLQLDYQMLLKDLKSGKSDIVSNLHSLGKRYSSLGKQFEGKMIFEQEKLIKLQSQLEKDYDRPFIGTSVSDTISSLLLSGQGQRAQKVKDEFKVPDKRFWWIKMQALVTRKDWDSLNKFARSKRSPIGYLPFYQAIFKAGEQRVASQYISLCNEVDYKRRIEMCIECNDIKQAVNEAIKAKDVESLENLQGMASGGLQREISASIASLRR